MIVPTPPHTASLLERWGAALGVLWRAFHPAWLAMPLAIAVALGASITLGHWSPTKADLERAAIQILAAATALAGVRLALGRDPFFLWGTALLAVLLSREIHFAGTTTGVYLGLLALLAVALHRFEALREHLLGRLTLHGLVLGLFSYAIAVSLDARWWKQRGGWRPGIPGEEVFHVPLEESMELVGHLLIAVAVLCARRVGSEADAPRA